MGIKRNLFRDILRDTNSKKYSMTKVAALITIILLVVAVSAGIWVMIKNKDVDHILIGELITLLLTLLGFKNAKTMRQNKDKQSLTMQKNRNEQSLKMKEISINENDILDNEDNDEMV